MLRFSPAFQLESGASRAPHQTRILGESPSGDLLLQVNAKSGCSIELISPDGSSAGVMLFHRHVDFMSAAVSSDRSLLHVSYRLAARGGYQFNAMLYSVQRPTTFREFKGDFPFDAIFVDSPPSLIHIAGPSVSQYAVAVVKDKFVLEKVKGGLQLSHVVSWQYDRRSLTFWAATEFPIGIFSLHEVALSNPGAPVVSSRVHIRRMPTGVLPVELALAPTTPILLPMYRPFRTRMFTYRTGHHICVIQQLFEGVDASCAFAIDIYPDLFSRTVFVPGVSSDLPLCFIGAGSIVCVFVPNYFLCVVCFGRDAPLISMLPKQFSASVCGRCCANSPVQNHIVDLDSADVYHVSFDFSATALLHPIMTRTGWDVVAQVCASCTTVDHLSNFLRLIEVSRDASLLPAMLRAFFRYLAPPRPADARRRASGERPRTPRRIPASAAAHLAELDRHFPAADGGSRGAAFRALVDEFADARAADAAVQRAFQELNRQNQTVLCLREALELWIRAHAPRDADVMRVGLVLQSETLFARLPGVPGLREGIASMIEEEVSRPIAHCLAGARVVRPLLMDRAEEEELLWWQERLPRVETFDARRRLRKAATVEFAQVLDALVPSPSLDRLLLQRMTF
jgi:hypothetical protein